MKKISILGSTGSIGQNTLQVIDNYDVEVVGLSCHQQVEILAKQVNHYQPQIVAIMDEYQIPQFKAICQKKVEIVTGVEGLAIVAAESDADVVVTAVVGAVGLIPTIRAIEAHKQIALANKETLVMAGEMVMALVERMGGSLLPVDSEHSAIHQCLHHRQPDEIKRIILTASGGPFRTWQKDDFETITPADALKHPTWNMGAKITIDSATMMNKGLEVIEAKHLFGIDDIDVVVHPQSIIHSMVEFVDGSMMAQLSTPDMKLPIQYALTYPYHQAPAAITTDLVKIGTLTFEAPDIEKFPCLKLAYDALQEGGTMPAVLNASNEVAVEAFLNQKIGFTDIPRLIEQTMTAHSPVAQPILDDLLHLDEWARQYCCQLLA